MKFVKEFICKTRPTDDEIYEGIYIANNDDCIVKLRWFLPYSDYGIFCGWYELYIWKGKSFEECKKESLVRKGRL